MQDYQFDHFAAVEEMWEDITHDATEAECEADYRDKGWGSRCVCCGATFEPHDGDRAEVVNRSTGARGIAHAECYLNETDTYELA